MAATEETKKVAELIEGANEISMLTSRAPDGTLESRPMAMQETEFDGTLWFFAERTSSLVEHIGPDPQVNVAVVSNTVWVSLTGRAEVVDDVERKKELWNSVVEAWMPEGPESEETVLIRVDGDSAEYWDTPGRVATAISFVKAKATGERYEGGDTEKVDL